MLNKRQQKQLMTDKVKLPKSRNVNGCETKRISTSPGQETKIFIY